MQICTSPCHLVWAETSATLIQQPNTPTPSRSSISTSLFHTLEVKYLHILNLDKKEKEEEEEEEKNEEDEEDG